MNGCFVTGTDTGVGKTTVSVAILAAAAHRGLKTAAIKPAESGCSRSSDGTLIPQDALALLQAGNIAQSLDDVCLYRFEEALAPGVAAARAGVRIDVQAIVRKFRQTCAGQVGDGQPDLLLVEGAGGLLVPFGNALMVADVARELDLPLLIVARAGLGTINHTLLTLEAAATRGLHVTGFVFSCTTPGLDADFIASNAKQILDAHPTRYLGCLPHLSRSHWTTGVLANAGAGILDSLLGCL